MHVHNTYGTVHGKVNDNYVSQLMVFGKSTSLSMNFLWLSTRHRDGLYGSGYRLTVSGQFTVAEIVEVKMQDHERQRYRTICGLKGWQE